MAAAFAALVSLQNNLRLIRNHPNHTFSFEEEQIQPLWGRVSFLIDFLKSYNYSHGAIRETTESLELRIARAAQEAEDVIEGHIVDQIRCGKTRSSRFLLDLHKVSEKLHYMRRKALNAFFLLLIAPSGMLEQSTYPSSSSSSTQSTPLLTSSMVGFDDILLQLLHLLARGPLSRRVIPIEGMGGIGKTTLAINAFHHPYIVQHFDVCLWATISQEYSIHKILAQLLSCLRRSTSGTFDEMRERLYKSLFGLRYLIVLDDMWNLKVWDDMNVKSLFPDTNNGSRVVVTTRLADVAYHLGDNGYGIAMSFLDEANSWHLFCQNAFAKQQVCPPELEETARKIVARCKGLPLAIVVVGGHLRKSPTALAYWENVAQSILYSTGNDEQCLNVLSLSYRYLPVHLKPCFLLLGAFPEDEEIFAQDVVKLWIAEGLIQHIDDFRLEDVAVYYLFDLFMRNLILVDKWDYKGAITTFKVHDIVREMCLQTAKEVQFLSVFETAGAIIREHRVVISGEAKHETISSDAPACCLISSRGRYSIHNPHDLKWLRTLSKVVTTLTSELIFQQVNLRYLNLNLVYIPHPVLYYLPSSISLLWNLQILTIIVPDQSKVIAPYGIWEMLQLRQIEVDPICLIDPLPVDQANEMVMRNLYKLLKVENFRLSEVVCKRIPNVRELRLSYCGKVSLYYCPRNLGCLHQLDYLALQFDGNTNWREFATSLTFPSSLRVLRLSGCCGVDWEELTMMVGSLPHLEMLLLFRNSVIGSVWTPVEGKFCHLKTLIIDGCGDLVCWNADNSHFPVLENLNLRDLSKLIEFPSGIGEIATLKSIDLRFCSASSTLSAMRTLLEQLELGNESLRLNVYFRGDEETMESFKNDVREEGLTSSSNLSLRLFSSK
ncbi:putative late blight resistance protein homolog R1B-16 [Salvia hispanica]|uniref:putative late blight resistance protein homolog R1B-16 n=1 Tax=Salvia hispanica TaxID=49212 RepID=UPI0020095BE3|nr:putative late blight resistance protein homolog R1B-16 [Salvia hispanica]